MCLAWSSGRQLGPICYFFSNNTDFKIPVNLRILTNSVFFLRMLRNWFLFCHDCEGEKVGILRKQHIFYKWQ